MVVFIKKLFDKICWILLGIIVVAIALFSLYLGIASAAEIILKFFSVF